MAQDDIEVVAPAVVVGQDVAAVAVAKQAAEFVEASAGDWSRVALSFASALKLSLALLGKRDFMGDVAVSKFLRFSRAGLTICVRRRY